MDSPPPSAPVKLPLLARPIPFTAWCTPRFIGKVFFAFVIICLLHATTQNLIYFNLDWPGAVLLFLITWLLLWLVFRHQTRDWHARLRPRRLRNSLPLAILSLVFCIACAEHWKDSYSDGTHGWSAHTATTDQNAQFWHGQFYYSRLTFPQPSEFDKVLWHSWTHGFSSSPQFTMQDFATSLLWHGTIPGTPGGGFAWGAGAPSSYGKPSPRATVVIIPCWIPVVLAALLPFWWIERFIQPIAFSG